MLQSLINDSSSIFSERETPYPNQNAKEDLFQRRIDHDNACLNKILETLGKYCSSRPLPPPIPEALSPVNQNESVISITNGTSESTSSQTMHADATSTVGTCIGCNSLVDEYGSASFLPSTDVRFRGCGEDTVKELFLSLNESFFKLWVRVRHNIQCAQSSEVSNLKRGKCLKKLSGWQRLHPNFKKSVRKTAGVESVIKGQDHLGSLPISIALRKLLKVPLDDELSIDSRLETVSLPNVHASLVSWFVFDILEDKHSFNNQPFMVPLEWAMKTQRDFGQSSKRLSSSCQTQLTTCRISSPRRRRAKRVSTKALA
jgi:hypothetical protein